MPQRNPRIAIGPGQLRELVSNSPLLPDAHLRAHWRVLLPWLDQPAQYELLVALLATEQAVALDSITPTEA